VAVGQLYVFFVLFLRLFFFIFFNFLFLTAFCFYLISSQTATLFFIKYYYAFFQQKLINYIKHKKKILVNLYN
jgi:hypothetical protein